MVVEGALKRYADYLNSFQITEFVWNAWEDVEILRVSSILHYREQLRPQVQRQITAPEPEQPPVPPSSQADDPFVDAQNTPPSNLQAPRRQRSRTFQTHRRGVSWEF